VFDCEILPSGQLRLTGEQLGTVTSIAIFDASVPVSLLNLQSGNVGCDLTPADFTVVGDELTSNNPLFCSTSDIVIVLNSLQFGVPRSLVIRCGGEQ
jgi:hypothetical protein